MKKQHFWIDDQQIAYWLAGESEVGADEVLLAQDHDLCRADWGDDGFYICEFISKSYFLMLLGGLKKMIFDKIKSFHPELQLSDFQLTQYHRYVSDAQHTALIASFRKCFPVAQLPIDIRLIEDRVGEACGRAVTVENPHDGSREFCLRIVRPQPKADSNPPHRDVYLDHLRDGINIYVPLAGSNALSSLPLLPASHRLSERLISRTAHGARVNGIQYTVPCITEVRGELRMTRPNPSVGDMMVFSPYLVHGGGANLNEDVTRVSLEMRFWGKGG